MRQETLVGLLVAAAVIYVPLITILILKRRNYTDALAVGGSITVFCLIINVIFPPVGLILFLTVHTFGLYMWIVRSISKKPDQDDSLPPDPEEIEEED